MNILNSVWLNGAIGFVNPSQLQSLVHEFCMFSAGLCGFPPDRWSLSTSEKGVLASKLALNECGVCSCFVASFTRIGFELTAVLTRTKRFVKLNE